MALRAILDQPQAVRPGDLGEGRQFGRLAIKMHRQDRRRPAGRRRLQDAQRARAEPSCRYAGLDVDQHRRRAGPLDRRDRRDRGVRHGEDEVTRADPAGAQRDLDGIGPAGDADRVRNPDEIRKCGLEQPRPRGRECRRRRRERG